MIMKQPLPSLILKGAFPSSDQNAENILESINCFLWHGILSAILSASPPHRQRNSLPLLALTSSEHPLQFQI